MAMNGLDLQLSRALSAASTTRDVTIAAGSLGLLPAVLRPDGAGGALCRGGRRQHLGVAGRAGRLAIEPRASPWLTRSC